jgi:hypothetical protein
MELLVQFNSPAGQAHPMRVSMLNDVLCTYLNRDPIGYLDEIERGFAYLDGQITQEPSSNRFVLLHRRGEYYMATERWNEAYDLAHQRLAKIDQSRDSSAQSWHGAWTYWHLCHICHALGRPDELAAHAESLDELSEKNCHLQRTKAAAAFWKAVTCRLSGNERIASKAFHRGCRLLEGLECRDTFCADPMANYFEQGKDLQEAVGVRDRELASVAKKGMLHRASEVHIERCRLLNQLGTITATELSKARLWAAQLRNPKWCLDKLARIEASGKQTEHRAD